MENKKLTMPNTSDIEYTELEYWVESGRPAILANYDGMPVAAWVKNKNSAWLQLSNPLDLAHDKDGSHSFGAQKLDYDSWLNIFRDQLEQHVE